MSLPRMVTSLGNSHLACRLKYLQTSKSTCLLSPSSMFQAVSSIPRRSLITNFDSEHTVLFSDALKKAQSLIPSKDYDR